MATDTQDHYGMRCAQLSRARAIGTSYADYQRRLDDLVDALTRPMPAYRRRVELAIWANGAEQRAGKVKDD